MSRKQVKKKNKEKSSNLSGMLVLGLIFLFFTLLLVLVQANVRYTVRDEGLDILPKGELIRLKHEAEKKQYDDCNILLITDDSEACLGALDDYTSMLNQMKEHYDICDVSSFDENMLNQYDKLVLLVSKYQLLNDSVVGIKTWVKNGGNLLIAFPPESSIGLQGLFDVLGIKDGYAFSFVEGIKINNNFMIGGTGYEYNLSDPFDSSAGVVLYDDCEVFIESNGKYPIPILWRRKYGEGSVVFDNFGIYEKSYQGIHCAAFSLMGNYCIYPVINASTFYIDDFPSPVPQGDATYITRDYGMTIADFYSQVWWKNVYDLSRRYGIQYTALVIENYSNQVSGTFERNQEISMFQYYGNLILKSGGEIGIHGYNHMPLVLQNFDYKNKYDEYIQWPSKEDMNNSLDEVFEFTQDLYPEEELQVYVPPSNILSEEGRQVLAKRNIRAIASIYLSGDMAYDQEFGVNKEDGIIDTPRVISGYVLDDYMRLVAFSELNFHFVNTHFQHPDDVLDEDRGAALGWEILYSRLENYVDWLYTSSPDIRNLTGSEIAGAVQRYDLLDVDRYEYDNRITIKMDNFNEESWMFLRLNDNQKIKEVKNGEYTSVANNLYLLECKSPIVEIELE